MSSGVNKPFCSESPFQIYSCSTPKLASEIVRADVYLSQANRQQHINTTKTNLS